jgi:hypothetical protein
LTAETRPPVDAADNGAVLQEIERRRPHPKLDAVEISSSGIERVTSRHLSTLNAIQSFPEVKSLNIAKVPSESFLHAWRFQRIGDRWSPG